MSYAMNFSNDDFIVRNPVQETQQKYRVFRKEKEFNTYRNNIVNWDCLDLKTLKDFFVLALKYYRNLPLPQVSIEKFFEFFLIDRHKLISVEIQNLKENKNILWAVDKKGMCLIVKEGKDEVQVEIMQLADFLKKY